MAAIYIGTYAKYNAGSLAGAWLDLDDFTSYEDFMAACYELHKDEEDPEFMFQDWENIPDDFISESGLNAMYFELKNEVYDWDAFEAWMGAFSIDITDYEEADELIEEFNEKFMGAWDSKEDFAEQYAEDTYMLESIPQSLRYYFDWSAFARDLFMDDFTYWDGYVFC